MGTVRIPLANDKGYFLVDEEDVPLVTQYRWQIAPTAGKTYARAAVPKAEGKPRTLMAHRLILNTPPGVEVDHRDGNGLNNVRSNLREATRFQNGANLKLRRTNTSGYKGVSFVKPSGKWYASIMSNGKTINIGTFAEKEDAARAYDAKARELFGDFARTNFPLQDEQPERTIAMRDITAAEMKNHRVPARNSTGVRNVFLHVRTGMYNVRFSIDTITCDCGRYKTLDEARDVADRIRAVLDRD